MQIRDIVRHKETGLIGTVKRSSFGLKISGIYEDGVHWKTLGYLPEELAVNWEVVEESK